ncbi:Rne/Rng family ribonuclease [Bifidobacterium saguini DSM 23967]|uniref:Ribonuclease E n=2 Tax=Bifidobacterium saguini TaxID=762210 RepID=A0A087D9B8_9BIFI|nr:Rne/Rng family ribonuclease [Bifidobacterium saguini]KFI92118.1 Rne/Rng family ribonuclease [Bifidobacterium saguini DSM 23967]QTB90119.1 Rne/Rng family ribonuclease [Bifidobacterium saguini]
MQRAARSIVPTENPEGFVSGETDNSTVSNAGSQSSASNAVPAAASAAPVTRRRRGGRRVVRGAGAAGASLELQVQDHSAPLFEAPVLPAASQPAVEASAAKTDNVAASAPAAFDDEDDRPVRRRSRVRHFDDDADIEERPVRRRRHADDFSDEGDRRGSRSERTDRAHRVVHEDDQEERLLDAVDSLPEGHDSVRRGKPMTSLLFQEPVLPSTRYNNHRDDDEEEDEDEPRSRRRPHSRRFDDDADAEERTTTRSRRRSRDDRADRDDRDDDRDARRRNDSESASSNGDADADSTEDTRRSRRSRRLNAQERRAAAEVEQIEEDLELDDIAYAPITEEENDGEEESADSTRTRSRRRRRRGSRGESAAVDSDTAESSEEEARDEHESQEDDGEQTITRRRRRRRGSKNAEVAEESQAEEQPTIRRSRKQQYIDEITDVEGSTRLEAKKQRRRDNRRERSRQSQLMEQDFLARRENVDRLMVVREREHHTQISVVEDNVLVEHYVSDIQEVQTVGNIYLGRVQNVLPSMEAAFVDIGQARNGVLYAGEVNWDAARLEGQPRRIELAFKSGDPVLVQVTKDPIGHKGARLTSQVTLAGRFLVLVPSGGMTGVSRKLSERERSRLKNIVSKIAPKDMGIIIRTAAEDASEEAIVKDLESLVRQWERINAKREEFWHGKRPKLLQGEPDVAIRVVRDIFNDDFNKLIVEGDKVYDRIEEYLDTMAPDLKDKLEKWDPAEHEGKDVFDKWQIDSQLRKGMERQVYLPSGGSIVIDRTEAMTTIDVNTGRFIGRGKSLEETVTRCNLEASEEIARQLRLRDIGGMVMIDYVDMVMPANRDLVLRRLVECLARDRTKHQVAEVTSLGLVQMTRKRIGQGLVEAFSEECPTCKGRGFILHDQPTVSADYDDPYALRGGDPFVKTNKHGRGTTPAPEPAGSSADVKAKLAQIAAAAVAANNAGEE